MSALQALVEATDDHGRAAALLTAPVFDLIAWRATFRNACIAAQFDAGVVYLDALFEACAKPRYRGGFLGTDFSRETGSLNFIADGGVLS